jgi:hypothetical protein
VYLNSKGASIKVGRRGHVEVIKRRIPVYSRAVLVSLLIHIVSSSGAIKNPLHGRQIVIVCEKVTPNHDKEKPIPKAPREMLDRKMQKKAEQRLRQESRVNMAPQAPTGKGKQNAYNRSATGSTSYIQPTRAAGQSDQWSGQVPEELKSLWKNHARPTPTAPGSSQATSSGAYANLDPAGTGKLGHFQQGYHQYGHIQQVDGEQIDEQEVQHLLPSNLWPGLNCDEQDHDQRQQSSGKRRSH